jgi:hypothetical protein
VAEGISQDWGCSQVRVEEDLARFDEALDEYVAKRSRVNP